MNIKDESHLRKNKIYLQYEELEKKYRPQVINLNQYHTPVNFKEAKSLPIHRWYTYKEGFSPNFVRNFIERFNDKNEEISIFDPFGGIGTTVLEASLLGYQSYSNDVNPLSLFIAKTKSKKYTEKDLSCLRKHMALLLDSELTAKGDEPNNPTVIKYFDKLTLTNLLRVKKWIYDLIDEKIKSLFIIAFLSIIEKVSTHRKDGNGVKRKRSVPDSFGLNQIKQEIITLMQIIAEDLKSNSIIKSGCIYDQSSFSDYRLPEKVDLVITSPPYANCFDYSKIYLVELWLGDFFKSPKDQQEFREESIVSHVHYSWLRESDAKGSSIINKEVKSYLSSIKLWNKAIPNMLVSYFKDIDTVFEKLIPNLKENAIIGFVVGNSVYGGLVIPTDLLVANIAVNKGFELIGIEIYRHLSPSSQQNRLITGEERKYLRESLIILKWKN